MLNQTGTKSQLARSTSAGLQADCQTTVDLVDRQMSTWTPDSDLMRLNAAPVGAWQYIPADLARVRERLAELAG